MKHHREIGFEVAQCYECGGFIRRKSGCIGCMILDLTYWPLYPKDECWSWCGARRGPYGVMSFVSVEGKRITRSVHRIAYVTWLAPLLPFWDVMHRCEDDACVRPDHLFVGRQADRLETTGKGGALSIKKRNITIRPGGWRVWGDGCESFL